MTVNSDSANRLARVAAASFGLLALTFGAATVEAAPAGAATASGAAHAKGTFGPKGYGGVRLGMSAKQVKATKKLNHPIQTDKGKCLIWSLKGHPHTMVFVSKKLGVVGITTDKARTPQGIGAGATKKQLKKAYPTVKIEKETVPGTIVNATVKLHGKPKAQYVFQLIDGKVTELVLEVPKDDCG